MKAGGGPNRAQLVMNMEFYIVAVAPINGRK